MKEVVADKERVAFCGLYCGACRSYLRGRCPGCQGNAKASWCKVRACCLERKYATCADCREFVDPQTCAKYNNFMAKLFGLLFHSDRRACILQIREKGLEGHAQDMALHKRQTIKRGAKT